MCVTGAVDDSGAMPYYAEECASMLGVTFSSGLSRSRDIVSNVYDRERERERERERGREREREREREQNEKDRGRERDTKEVKGEQERDGKNVYNNYVPIFQWCV